jgi:hypothetical protein
MTTINMIPPSDGHHNSISVNGRTYASTSGISIPVPDFDAAVLQANGWTALTVLPSLSSTTVTATSGIPDILHVAATVNPPSPSAAIYPIVHGQIIYPDGAPAITAPGHVIGALGHVTNNNTTTPIGLAIGTEGKVDNATTTAAITTAVSLDANLGSNAGTITAWYGCLSDLASNAGTIGSAAFYGCNIDVNTGTIGAVYGLIFPTLNAGANITGTVAGLFFNNNPSITATKYVVFGADPQALIYTIGNIQTLAKTTTATFQLDTGTKTATAVTGAATLNKASGKITTESLTTPAGAAYTLTLTNSAIAAADTVYVSLANGTNSAGLPLVGLVTPAAGSVKIVVNNMHASAALNGTLVISFASMKA